MSSWSVCQKPDAPHIPKLQILYPSFKLSLGDSKPILPFMSNPHTSLRAHTHTRSLSLKHAHSLSQTHTLSLSLKYTHSLHSYHLSCLVYFSFWSYASLVSISFSLPLSRSISISNCLSLSLSLSDSHTHTHSLSLAVAAGMISLDCANSFPAVVCLTSRRDRTLSPVLSTSASAPTSSSASPSP